MGFDIEHFKVFLKFSMVLRTLKQSYSEAYN